MKLQNLKSVSEFRSISPGNSITNSVTESVSGRSNLSLSASPSPSRAVPTPRPNSPSPSVTSQLTEAELQVCEDWSQSYHFSVLCFF